MLKAAPPSSRRCAPWRSMVGWLAPNNVQRATHTILSVRAACPPGPDTACVESCLVHCSQNHLHVHHGPQAVGQTSELDNSERKFYYLATYPFLLPFLQHFRCLNYSSDFSLPLSVPKLFVSTTTSMLLLVLFCRLF